MIRTLGQIRGCTVVHHHDGLGRPRVTTHVDTADETIGARPTLSALGWRPIVLCVYMRRAVTELPRTHALAASSRFPRGKVTRGPSAAPFAWDLR